jgi:hypothetical protein
MAPEHPFVFDTNMGARVRFLRGAFKHGVSAADVLHALGAASVIVRLPPSGGRARSEWLFLGPSRSNQELEVIALLGRTEHFLVIHAMPMRAKWDALHALLRSGETP